jgi:hypothetical protein
MTTNYRIDIEAPTLETADASAKAVLERAKQSVGFIPNMNAGMAALPGVLTSVTSDHEFENVKLARPRRRSRIRFHGSR